MNIPMINASGAVRWVYWGFAAVGAYYLLTEHRAHLIDYLPYILLLACPLMHILHLMCIISSNINISLPHCRVSHRIRITTHYSHSNCINNNSSSSTTINSSNNSSSSNSNNSNSNNSSS